MKPREQEQWERRIQNAEWAIVQASRSLRSELYRQGGPMAGEPTVVAVAKAADELDAVLEAERKAKEPK